MSQHYSEDDLALYYYGEARKPRQVELHLESCAACKATYREIAGTLAMVTAPEVPERGDSYGLEVWQRIRHKLPEQEQGFGWFSWLGGFSGFSVAAAAAVLLIAAFVAGRAWQNQANSASPANPSNAASVAASANATNADARQRILLTSVADHLDRSERVLTDVMNTSGNSDISSAQRWADDLIATSRLYRQDAIDAGEQSVATVLDDLERSLIEIVHSPSQISAADLEQIRRRIDAAALLFKVRVMSDQLRQREQAPAARTLQTSTRKTS
jgi:hypothetical protein